VKRVLCYGDSNTWGTMPMRSADDVRRFGPGERWTGVMAEALGAGWTVIEEGLPGRTTVHGDPIEGMHLNGRTFLEPCLFSHWPLDVIALMLGTNDLKPRFSVHAADIAFGVGALLLAIRTLTPPWTETPEVLLICPPPAVGSGWLTEMFAGAGAKTGAMPALYEAQAKQYGAAFFDAGTIAAVSPVDGVHLEADQHRRLGATLANRVRQLA